MNLSTVRLIFRRELTDQLRDRRTLFMIVVLPVVLYPLVGFGIVQLMLHFGDQTRLVGVNGLEHLPKTPPLVADAADRFDSSLFESPKAQRAYRIIRPPARRPTEGASRQGPEKWSNSDLDDGKIDALVEIPGNAAAQLAAGKAARIQVVRNPQSDKSVGAAATVVRILGRWEARIVVDRLRLLGKDADFAAPIEIDEKSSVTIGVDGRYSGTIWGKVLPFVLVVMALTGAFYPAIDLCAGEKERGTMETLLISPAARSEIVLGKFLTIWLFSVGTTVCNLISMGLTVGQVSGLAPRDLPAIADALAAPTFVSIVWMLLLMAPLAAFFSALCMAIAIFARSTKEGQYYLMPMFLVVLPLVVLTLIPGVELNAFYSLTPVTNVALLLRSLMNNRYDVAGLYFVPVLAPTILYGYLALRFAVDRFEREDVIFREAERFEFRLWIKHMLATKASVPSAGHAWFCFGLLLVLQYYVQGRLPPARWSLIVSQLALILFPPTLLAIVLTTRPLLTLGIRRPAWPASLMAIMMAFTLHPVAANLGGVVQRFMPLSEEILERLTQLIGSTPLWQRLVIFALLPAVCEELAFRGFMLSGLARQKTASRAIATTAILFGLFHMIPQQMFTTVLVGLMLGLIVTRTGSILPGMCFHALHNGMMIYRGWSMERQGSGVATEYSFPVLVMGALSTALLVGTLASMRPRLPADAADAD